MKAVKGQNGQNFQEGEDGRDSKTLYKTKFSTSNLMARIFQFSFVTARNGSCVNTPVKNTQLSPKDAGTP